MRGRHHYAAPKLIMISCGASPLLHLTQPTLPLLITLGSIPGTSDLHPHSTTSAHQSQPPTRLTPHPYPCYPLVMPNPRSDINQSRGCAICRHPLRSEIDAHAVKKSLTGLQICEKYTVNLWTLNRHKANCIRSAVARQLRRTERRIDAPLLDLLISGAVDDASALRGLMHQCIATGTIGARDAAALATALDKHTQTLCKLSEAPGFKQIAPQTNVAIQAGPTQFFVLPAAPPDYSQVVDASPHPALSSGTILEGD